MDTRYPMTAVAPTLEGVVLQVLERTSLALTLSEIHELSGKGSVSGVRKTLLRLVSSGLVHATGSPPRYELNRDHLAYPGVVSLSRMRADLFERIRSLVQAWSSPTDLVGVFGSVARGSGDEESDIDILVLGKPSDDEVKELAGAIERWTGNTAQIVVLSTAEFENLRATNEPIVNEWESDLIVISGDGHALKATR